MAEYETGFAGWGGACSGLAGWELKGAALREINGAGAIVLDPATASPGKDPFPRGGCAGGDYYNGGSFLRGEATSPVVETAFALEEAIASWNAQTPPGSWIEASLRARVAGEWTPWYSMGVWAWGGSSANRHSVDGQDDALCVVKTDKLVVKAAPGAAPLASALQLRISLFGEEGSALPELRAASIAWSTMTPAPGAERRASTPGLLGRIVEGVPAYSQMAYPDGGRVWCSPTCVAMCIGYWEGASGEVLEAEARVRRTVMGVYDRVFDGHGNWAFCAAYAGSQGYEARVARFASLAELEPWIAAGVPVVLSVSWDEAKLRPLPGAPVSDSRGHLTLLVGFDATGDPVMNEPAAKRASEARLSYPRAALEARWLEASGGTAYLIYPRGRRVPL